MTQATNLLNDDGSASMATALLMSHHAFRRDIARFARALQKVDPLLERGDRAFAELPNSGEALSVVNELAQLLDAHLSTEEASVIPFLREPRDFPAPPKMLAMYAQGFAWSSHGVAPEVLQALDAMLPPSLASLLPAARAEFQARCDRV